MVTMADTYYDIGNFSLWSDVQPDGTTARMVLGFRDGAPRFKVYLGKDKGIIEFPMDRMSFLGVMFDFDFLIDAPSGTYREYDSLKPEYIDGVKQESKYIASQLKIGKTKEGYMYILVTAKDKEKIPFFIRPTDWHNYRDETKNSRETADVCRSLAKGFSYAVKEVVAEAIIRHNTQAYDVSEYKPNKIEKYDPNKPKSNGFKKGYGNANKSSVNTGTTPIAHVDSILTAEGFNDDIPF